MENSVKERLIAERDREKADFDKLNEFITSEKFEELDEENKYLLIHQSHIMHSFIDVLERRIDIN